MTHVRLKPRVPQRGSTHLADGVVIETLDGGELVTFTFTNLDVTTVDHAIEALGDLMRRRDEAGRPLRVLLDLQAGSGPDALRSRQAASFTRMRRGCRAGSRWVQPGTSIAHRIDRVLRSELYHYRERSLFFDRAGAGVAA